MRTRSQVLLHPIVCHALILAVNFVTFLLELFLFLIASLALVFRILFCERRPSQARSTSKLTAII